MILNLPFPPSANTSWRSIGRGRVVISAKYREFTQEVSQCVGIPEPLSGRLEVAVLLHAPTRRKYDVDNRIKPLLDAMQKAGVFEDDGQIDKLTVERGEVWPGKGTAFVWIERIDNLEN